MGKARIVKGAGRTARGSKARTMHGTNTEWRMFSFGGDRGNRLTGGLGPFLRQGKPTPRNPGRKGR